MGGPYERRACLWILSNQKIGTYKELRRGDLSPSKSMPNQSTSSPIPLYSLSLSLSLSCLCIRILSFLSTLCPTSNIQLRYVYSRFAFTWGFALSHVLHVFPSPYQILWFVYLLTLTLSLFAFYPNGIPIPHAQSLTSPWPLTIFC